jgi:DNA processing protein
MAVQTNSSAHPLIPLLKEEDRLAWLRLLRSRRVGISTFYRLLKEHGTAQSALEHLPEVTRAAGVDNYLPNSKEHAITEMRSGHKAGAHLIFRGTPVYPTAFNDLNDAPPFFLDGGGYYHSKSPDPWPCRGPRCLPAFLAFWPPHWGKRGM